MVKNLKSFRLTSQAIEKIQKIQETEKLNDETKALEHIITNFDMNSDENAPKISKLRITKVFA